MSLETEFSRIATALETIAHALIQSSQLNAQVGLTSVAPTAPVVQANEPVVAAPVVQPVVVPVAASPAPFVAPVAAPAPQPAIAPAPAAPVAAAPVIPAVVASPAAASPSNVAPPTCPITDAKTLMTYVMEVYRNLGPIKGAKIQNVLASLGVASVNDVKPQMYAQFYQGVEALKGE